jgi:hypothetical protein
MHQTPTVVELHATGFLLPSLPPSSLQSTLDYLAQEWISKNCNEKSTLKKAAYHVPYMSLASALSAATNLYYNNNIRECSALPSNSLYYQDVMCSFDIQLVIVLKITNGAQMLAFQGPPNSPAYTYMPPPTSGTDNFGLAWHDPLSITLTFTARANEERLLNFDRKLYERALLHAFPGNRCCKDPQFQSYLSS